MKLINAVKHSPQYADFAEKLKNNKAMHAYIIESNDTVFCDAFIVAVLLAVMCPHNACMSCSVCKKVLNKQHIDVGFYPMNGRAALSASEDIADFNDRISLRPYEGGNRAFVFNVGRTVREEWQNKLLKALEEPPENTFIFICVENAERLLPTVQSRCARLYHGKAEQTTILDFLADRGVEQNAANESVLLCDGNVTKAIAYAENEAYREMAGSVRLFLSQCKSSKNIAGYLEKMSSYKEMFGELTDMFVLTFFQAMRVRYSDNENAFGYTDQLIKINENYTEKGCAEAIGVVTAVKRRQESNVNLNALLDDMLLRLMEVKYKCRIS